jgi:hypothetical protein
MALSARFLDLRNKVLAEVDKAFAEPVRISPMGASGAADPARPVVVIEAPLRTGGGKNTNLAGGYAQSWRTRIVAQKAELHIDRAKYPDLVIRGKDRVRALARPGQPLFEVLHVDDRNHTRLVLELGEA